MTAMPLPRLCAWMFTTLIEVFYNHVFEQSLTRPALTLSEIQADNIWQVAWDLGTGLIHTVEHNRAMQA